jgi:hypothetical protein
MKKNTLILLLFFIAIFSTFPVHAAITPTPKSTTPTQGLDKQFDLLKEKIASRVAQLKLVEKKGIIGTVTDVAETQITLTDRDGNTRLVDVDELTKFSSPSAKGSFGISDITRGSIIGILGLYNKESRRILARFVDVKTLPQLFSGVVISIDKDNYNFDIATQTQKDVFIDVETISKIDIYNVDSGLVKAGFSKLKINERVFIVGFPDIKDKNKIVASRILLFPSIPANPQIPIAKPETPTEAITPTKNPTDKKN